MLTKLHNKLLELRVLTLVYFWKLANLIFKKNTSKVQFIIEKENWAIKRVGTYIVKNINNKLKNLIAVSSTPEKFQNKIIHFGSHYLWVLKYKHLPKNNKYIVSFFHGNPNESLYEKQVFKKFLNSIEYLDKIIVSNDIVYNRLINSGIDEKLIIKIPIGVDTSYFKPPSIEERLKARSLFNFTDNDIVIGSFQKDGQGWKDGMKPKLIKGPDLFYKVVSKLNKNYKIKILLTGPARGYLKNKLDEKKVSYFHSYLKNYEDLINFYHALDFYLITSREEGGPMGLLESISSGIRVVSTNVGMASDFIKNQEIGIIVKTSDPNIIAEKFKNYIQHGKSLGPNKIGRQVIEKADWKIVSDIHLEKVYKSLLEQVK